jgi:hypothetical protein
MLPGLLLVAACAGDGSSCAALPGGARYCLQTTAAIEPFDAQQKVDIAFDGRQETMIAQLESDADGMRLVGMTPFGQKLLQLGFDNRNVSAEAFSGKGPDPIVLLAVVQLATWPAEQVRAGLGDKGAISLIEEQTGEQPQRRVVKDGKDIVVVRYTRGRPPSGDMVIQLPSAGVEFTITHLDMAATQ